MSARSFHAGGNPAGFSCESQSWSPRLGGELYSPDAMLLAVCAKLAAEQDHWQRLWEAAGRPNDASRYDANRSEAAAPEVMALREYTRRVWPATDDPFPHLDEVRTDVAHGLISIPALTPEGMKAKAAAILALDEVATYSELRDDQSELVLSLLRDVAGSARRPVGDAA